MGVLAGVFLFAIFFFVFSTQTVVAAVSNARFSFYLGGHLPLRSCEEPEGP
jgi:hypothetical protein